MARLVFLGRLADLAGAAMHDVPAGPLAAIIAGLPADLAAALDSVKVRRALNGVLIAPDPSLVLAPGDELAFLPPVSGG